MAKYKISGTGVQDTELGHFIPNDTGNRHWVEYLAWVDDGNTADPEFTELELEEIAWSDLRSQRDYLLLKTDFMMAYDYYNNIMDGAEQSAVTTYRSELRDLPANTVDPTNVTWPTKPQIIIDNGI
jgi:hypothetical protein